MRKRESYRVVFKELFVPVLEQIELRVADLGVLLFVDLPVRLPDQIVGLGSPVGREFSMEDDDQILGHVLLNSIRRREELPVNLAGRGHVPRPHDVASLELVVVPAVNDHKVFLEIIFASHV